MVFQHFTLFPQLTVIQNVMLGPYRVLHHSRDAARRQAELVLQRVGLLNKQDSFPAHLSGGEMQRAAIARELAMERRVILFDEVTSALDPELVHEVVEVMQELGRTGMTMIVVTHEMGFARKAAQEIVFMDAGAVVETGSPEAIFGDAKEERTRAFLSKMLS
jgi:ABC-type polar amino acid transport system ATPase subunit